MTKFEKPGAGTGTTPTWRAKPAPRLSRTPASRTTTSSRRASATCYGESTCGQRAVYELGLTGIPVYNVNNNCSTGSTALFMAKQLVEGGLADCVLALGFREDGRRARSARSHGPHEPDGQAHRADGRAARLRDRRRRRPRSSATPAASTWSATARPPEHFAKIADKNHKHSVNNPYSQFQRRVHARADPRAAPMVHGAAHQAAVLPDVRRAGRRDALSEEVVKRHGLEDQAVEIVGHGDGDRLHRAPSTTRAAIKLIGSDMTARRPRRRSTSSRASARRTSTSSSCTTASRRTSWSPTRPSASAPRARRGTLIDAGAVTYGGTVGRQPVGRAHLEGPPARRDRPGAVRGAELAAARPGRQAPGRPAPRSRFSTTSASAAPPS